MKPAEHYRRARELMDQAESSWAAGDNDPTARAERLERLQFADVHTKLGQLADTIGDAQTFLSSNAQQRIVITLPIPAGAERFREALNAGVDSVFHQAAVVAHALAGHARNEVEAEAFAALATAIEGHTVWEDDDEMRRFAATDVSAPDIAAAMDTFTSSSWPNPTATDG